MQVRLETQWTQKLDSPPGLCEDASFPPPGIHELDGLKVVVADGASESFFSRLWAKELVEKFSHRDLNFTHCWQNVQQSWPGVVRAFLSEREANGKAIQWFEEPALGRGGFGTAISAHFHELPGITDRAKLLCWAIGDCCIIQLRGERVPLLFPLTSPEQFDSTPDLIFSNDNLGALALKRKACLTDVRPGDRLLLMTDALAHWTLTQVEAGIFPWAELDEIARTDAESFSEWVKERKTAGLIKDDDITLVTASVLPRIIHG